MEDWVHTPRGRLYVKRWLPVAPDASSRAPIILFHDSLGSVTLWRDFPEHLAGVTGREVIAYDRLGFGQSDPYPGKLDAGFVREEAREGFPALCRQLQLEQFVLFGHSVGGAMAAVCAGTYPDRCQALITESSQAFVEDRTLSGISDAERGFAQEGQMDRLKKYHGEKAAWVLNAWVETWHSEAFRDWTMDEDLRRVRCPVLAIHGENDEYGSLLHPERYSSLPSGPSTMLIVPDCGHLPHREKQDIVLEAVKAFLA
jgi:Predicted hydrolases or acyltransferases (alpha/beta hydrolase superfamily)